MFGRFGVGEIIFLVAVLVLLFGAKRLPGIAAGLGKGIREFKRSASGQDELPPAESPPPPAELPRLPTDDRKPD